MSQTVKVTYVVHLWHTCEMQYIPYEIIVCVSVCMSHKWSLVHFVVNNLNIESYYWHCLIDALLWNYTSQYSKFIADEFHCVSGHAMNCHGNRDSRYTKQECSVFIFCRTQTLSPMLKNYDSVSGPKNLVSNFDPPPKPGLWRTLTP